MNASAMSEIKLIPDTTSFGIRSRQNGPIATPVSMYAVTFGSFNNFVIRVAKKPVISIIPIDIMTTETLPAPPSLSYNPFNNVTPLPRA